MDLLNAGRLELVDYMGSDLAVVQAARISNGAVLPDWREAKDEKLINYLAAHGHMTPFEHAVFKFYVKAPIFVIREWQRHRALSYNEMSARYKKLEPQFYYPDEVRVADPNNKQGSIVSDNPALKSFVLTTMSDVNSSAFDLYEAMLQQGVAREIARSVLPVGIYSEMMVTGNFRNWMHFYELRASTDAQYEIRVYAKAIGSFLEMFMPTSFEALARKE